MFSTDDELDYDQSFETDGSLQSPRPPLTTCLANELDFAFQEASNRSQEVSLPASPSISGKTSKNIGFIQDQRKQDYTGRAWGRPEDDPDPDQRFHSLDNAIDALLGGVNFDNDSAYTSDDCDALHTTTGSECVWKGIENFCKHLQDVPSQLPLEQHIQRLLETYKHSTALLQNRFQELRELTYLATSCVDESSEGLCGVLTESLNGLLEELPVASSHIHSQIIQLEAETNALIADLALLSDALQETRQLANQASRALRTSKDACLQWRREVESAQRSQDWLEHNASHSRLCNRSTSLELAQLQREFADVCEHTRYKIMARQ